MEAFRAVRRLMPLQHAYTFVLVAFQEGAGVSEYAKRAGVTQAVMTRILFALSSHNQGRGPGYDLVQQAPDPEDGRRHQTFLTIKGKALMHQIVQAMRSDRHRATGERAPQGLARDQWLSQLVAAARKLGADDVQLAVRQIELLTNHRRSKKPPVRRQRPRVDVA